ncbi:hypothetical protein ACJMK2_021794 [Sinanodonta woodiana]|uniref:Uncharacterized protein n=1 Tax=Sinanodonta woodiana TaxID=1069815 RepID=A0ABD3TH46_SINWO
MSDETEESTQVSYHNGQERCHAKLPANCDMPRLKTRTFRVQVAPECKSSAVQCNRKHRTKTQQTSEADAGDDPSWTPDVSEDHNVEYTADPHKTLKYIVFENSLMELLDVCPMCIRTNLQHQKCLIGSCLCVNTYCLCGFYRSWTNQPLHHSMGKFNCGSSCFFQWQYMNSYNTIQSSYIVPATLSLWEYKQHLYLDHVRGTGQASKLSGDARCSSLGHTAKYGSYTSMDVRTSKVVDIQLVQCNEVNNSYAMELEGLTRSLQFMQEGMLIFLIW